MPVFFYNTNSKTAYKHDMKATDIKIYDPILTTASKKSIDFLK